VFARWSAQLQSLLWEARPQLHDEVDTGRLARFVIATLEGALLVSRVDRDANALRGIAWDLKRFVAMHVREPAVVLAAGRRGRRARRRRTPPLRRRCRRRRSRSGSS
jgi:hypothetical protein